MAIAEPTADCSFEDLLRIYRENCGLSCLAECNRALRALRQLKMIRPKETEAAGERMEMEEIQSAIDEATQAMAVFRMNSSRVQVITPSAFR